MKNKYLFLSLIFLMYPTISDANDLEDFFDDLFEITIAPITMPTEILIAGLEGEDIGDEIQDQTHDFLDAHESLADQAVDIHNSTSEGAREVVRDVAGNSAGDAVDIVAQPQERLARYTAAAVGASVALIKGEGLTAIPAKLLSQELQQVESTFLPSSKSLPNHVKKEFLKFFSKELVDNSRYYVGSKVGSVDVATALNYIRKMFNVDNAVAAGRVIIFSKDPGTNYVWWSHEMGHMQQYADYGFYEFAYKYVENCPALERDADKRAKASPVERSCGSAS